MEKKTMKQLNAGIALGDRPEFKKASVRPMPVDGLAAAIYRIEDVEERLAAAEQRIAVLEETNG